METLFAEREQMDTVWVEYADSMVRRVGYVNLNEYWLCEVEIGGLLGE